MASIFTFDPDPPRVSSPWATATPPSDTQSTQSLECKGGFSVGKTQNQRHGESTDVTSVDYTSITRLEAEPQEGPTEYKLHLLLRRRRSFITCSTARNVSGSLRRSESYAPSSFNRVSNNVLSGNSPPLSATQSRQHRLQQLTTQMLWRLQQSCPHHSSSSMAGVKLQFPDEASLSAPTMPHRLYPGLEESKGALYEIGVADDGELVGLAEDEMEESLNNLRTMAASLGCQVDVVRMVIVGDCEWLEGGSQQQCQLRKSKLLVAEAYVHPDSQLMDHDREANDMTSQNTATQSSLPQLRVSLTGATTSGKSSLLGTLSTGTLDNGRGKSRLSLLKHRHEIESGITSSITQELIGYGEPAGPKGDGNITHVVNFGSADISSWTDIHAGADSASGRLVFLTDSAGHTRFRRTTVRGLIGWDPHYTLLCIPADDTEEMQAKQGLANSSRDMIATDVDLSGEHLRLCLSLELPLVIVVTKYDLAKKAGLKGVLTRILSALKESGRTGRIVTDISAPEAGPNLGLISSADLLEAEKISQAFELSPLGTVPIVLTSALKGTGLGKLHALLRTLPVPTISKPEYDDPHPLFHIEDVYTTSSIQSSPDKPIIIGGHLSSGELRLGDKLVLGPYPVDSSPEDSDSGSGRPSMRNSPLPTSRSFPGALQKRSIMPQHGRTALGSMAEWRTVRVTSLRNLRLPVSSLHRGQVGTVGITPVRMPISSPAITRIRKGMVLTDRNTEAHKLISVEFAGSQAQSAKALTIGSAVVVFFASVRAPSKVLSVTPIIAKYEAADMPHGSDPEEGFGFDFGFDDDPASNPSKETNGGNVPTTTVIVQFQFIGSREFVKDGAKILVMPGGGPGLSGSIERGEKGVAGLEGFVGNIVEGCS